MTAEGEDRKRDRMQYMAHFYKLSETNCEEKEFERIMRQYMHVLRN